MLLNYHHFESDLAPFQYLEKGFARLKQAVEWCDRHGSANQHDQDKRIIHSSRPSAWGRRAYKIFGCGFYTVLMAEVERYAGSLIDLPGSKLHAGSMKNLNIQH